MPDSTNDFGGSWDLTIPNGEDTVDIVRDVGTLGVEVDAALSEAFVGSIDVDAGGVTNFGTDGPPLRLHGTGRPDGRGDGDLITAPTGSSYTCTTPNADGNFGALEWKYDGSLWHCVEGDTGYRAVTNNTGWTGAGKISKIQKWDNPQVSPAGGTRVRGMQRWGNKFYLFVFWNESSLGTTSTGYYTVWFADGGDPFTGVGTASGFSDSASASTAYGTLSGFCGNTNVRFSCELGGVNNQIYITGTTDHPWPSGVDGINVPPLVSTYIAELKAQIEEAAENNPELAEQLRQELEELRSSDGE